MTIVIGHVHHDVADRWVCEKTFEDGAKSIDYHKGRLLALEDCMNHTDICC